ncbi:hypothetical protein VTJ49DRAFT_5724 [Mycothermus thermophilus]|uniref:glucosamine-6-phosphate deaminase n=1 Tax=Humicola insolens TaxID=85995 RepID=A0ABR3VL95_HUMIN
MRFIIRDDPTAASAHVANYIVDRINRFSPTPKHPFALGLPTGSTPLGVYQILVEKYKAGEVSFENVVTFNMDEYIGIPRHHPESYHTFMWKHLFSHINIHPRNVHILNGNAPDLAAECTEYEAKIRAAGGIELFLAGMGEDGHIAFNEPGSSLASHNCIKALSHSTVLANSRFFGGDSASVPRTALTVGVQTVLNAREVVVLVLGPRKALALQRCLEGGVNHMWTLSALQLHPNAMIVCDEDATLELQVKTVKYFKEIEKLAQDHDSHHPLRTTTNPPKNAMSTATTPALTTSPTNTSPEDAPDRGSTSDEHYYTYNARTTDLDTFMAHFTQEASEPRWVPDPDPNTNSDSDLDLADDDDFVPDSMSSRIIGDPNPLRRATPSSPGEGQDDDDDVDDEMMQGVAEVSVVEGTLMRPVEVSRGRGLM